MLGLYPDPSIHSQRLYYFAPEASRTEYDAGTDLLHAMQTLSLSCIP